MESFDFNRLLSSGEMRNTETVVAIGVFDGLHLGHREIIRNLIEERKNYPGSKAVIISFNINPKGINEKPLESKRIKEEKLTLFTIDYLITIDFSLQFSRISAVEFLKMLLSLSKTQALVVGEDFKFGNPLSSASAHELQALLNDQGSSCSVNIVQPILTEGGEKISSTLLRRMIKEGRVEEFPQLSGQKYILDLKAKHKIINNGLVFRTEDIDQLTPRKGVYSASLIDENSSAIKCNAFFDDEEVFIRPESEENVDLVTVRTDKLLLERKVNGFS